MHLAEAYGPKWLRTGPAELRVIAGSPTNFDPKLLPTKSPGSTTPGR